MTAGTPTTATQGDILGSHRPRLTWTITSLYLCSAHPAPSLFSTTCLSGELQSLLQEVVPDFHRWRGSTPILMALIILISLRVISCLFESPTSPFSQVDEQREGHIHLCMPNSLSHNILHAIGVQQSLLS